MVTRHTHPGQTDRGIPSADHAHVAALDELLAPANVRINGTRPWDLQIHDSRALDQILRRGSLGAGEAYMRGWWTVPKLDEFFFRVLQAGIDRRLRSWHSMYLLLRALLTNPQRPSRAFRVGEAHYDLDNDLFAAMLDKRMVYSCAYWAGADTLDEAQDKKLELICRKLDLQPGQRLLDIGCGWGSLCHYAAERYGVSAVGLTVSKRQAELARQVCSDLPVEIRLQDYRELDERFDHVVSVGMFEHVGARNHRAYFETVRRCLRPGGLFLLHTIGNNETAHATDAWIERYVFPRGQIPALAQISKAVEGLFIVEDLHNFGSDYDRTLMAWHRNFERAWKTLKQRYDRTFYRMWSYYLLSCAGAFRARSMQLWQLVLSPGGVPGGYVRPSL